MILNTDGVSIFKSSRLTIWPIYIQVANLLPALQVRLSNIITCGVWVGQKKPKMSVLLAPVLEPLEQLGITGFPFLTCDGLKTIRVKLLFCVFDLVAKAAVLNIKQFNGSYGCPTCLHPGEHHGIQVYPPGKEYSTRTCRGVAKAIRKGKALGTVVEG